MYLYVNGGQVPESQWHFGASEDAVNDNVGSTGSRIMVSNPLEMIAWKPLNVKSPLLQILHMEAGDTMELRMTDGDYISDITLNIELIGLGFDYRV